MNIHRLIRANNLFWRNLYYDEIIEETDFQISYCKKANEPYYNTVHAVSTPPPFQWIESYFESRKQPPSFYTDTVNEQWLVPLLLDQGYQELESQIENIWYMNLSTQKSQQAIKGKPVDFEHEVEFRPAASPDELRLFLEINSSTNELPADLAESLFQNLQHPYMKEIECRHFILFKSGEPAGCGSVGIYNNCAFMAEGGILTNQRQQGLHGYIMQQRALFARARNAKHLLTTCSHDAFTNRTAKRLGMERICTRRFFQKRQIMQKVHQRG